MTLSKRQREILAIVEDAVATKGEPPMIVEIAAALGVKSRGYVSNQLDALEHAGALRRQKYYRRGITLPDTITFTVTLRSRTFLDACRAENVRPEIKAAEIINQWCGDQ